MRPYGLECSRNVKLKDSKRLLRTRITHLLGLLWFRASSIGLLFLCLADLGLSADRDSPKNLQQLNDSYPSIERDENSAEVYLRAFEELARDVKTGTWTNLPLVDSVPLPLPGETLSSQHDAAISALIARNQRAWILIVRGSELSKSRYPIDLTQGAGCQLPHLTGLIRGAQFLVLRAIWNAYHGKPGPASESIYQASRMAAALGNEPVLLSQGVRARMFGMVKEGLALVLCETTLPPAMSDRLRLLFRALEEQEVAGSAFKRATIGHSLTVSGFLAGETDVKVAVLKRDDRFENEGSESLRRRLFVRPGESDATLFERGLNQMLEAWELPYPARGRVFAALRTVVPMQTNSSLVFGDYVVSSTASALFREARCLASLRLLELALALDQFASGADGTFPTSVDPLVPKHVAAIPMDPFSGSYFVYQCGPDRRSYSLRSSGSFDSVAPQPADPSPDGITFSVVKRRPGIKRAGAEAR